MLRLRRIAIALIVVVVAGVSGAHAEKRVALVVGNGAYQHASELPNPKNDARDVTLALAPLGFKVIFGSDLTKAAFDRKLREFVQALEGADVGVFFFAGHGLQVKGSNYLVPIDAKLEAERDLDFETLRVDAVLSHMEREAKTNIVFLDACRNNPLARNLARTMGTRGVEENKGLAPVASALGTFIAFATQPGAVASDGVGRNSPFSAALKKHIPVPGMSVTDLMIEVRKEVVGATKGSQVPWDHSALQGRFYFNGGAPAPVSAINPSTIPELQSLEAEQTWQLMKETTDISVLEAFISRYGSTSYGDFAKMRLAALKQSEAAKKVDEERQRAVEAKRTADSEERIRIAQELEQKRLAAIATEQETKRREVEAAAEAKRRALSKWAAVATNSAGHFSWSLLHDDKVSAESAALEQCNRNKRGRCKIEDTMQGQCFALYRNRDGAWAWSARDDISQAREAANSRCNLKHGNCYLSSHFCADGSNVFNSSK